MTSRIDSITIELDVWDENAGGRRTVRVPVPLDDEMVPAVEKRWRDYSDELMRLAGTSTSIGFL